MILIIIVTLIYGYIWLYVYDMKQDVSFRYREKLPLVLRKLNLQLTPGQRVGVVGRTGSGKSTLLRQSHVPHV